MTCLRLALPFALLGATSAFAQDNSPIPGEFSATVTTVSNYTFRGITQTDDSPALQGSVDYAVDVTDTVGFYAGVWGSNVDFNDGNEATVEIDVYSGLTYTTGPVGLDLGVFYYWYPGAASSLNYDYFELALGASLAVTDQFNLTAGTAYSPENFGKSGQALYLNAGADYTFDSGVDVPITLFGAVGYQMIERELTFGAPDYFDWTLGISAEYDRYTASIAYVDNDIAGGDDSNLVLQLSVTF